MRNGDATGNAPIARLSVLWHFDNMLCTANDVLDALAARKTAVGLSNATVDALAGLTLGHFDKIAGPTRGRFPRLDTFMALVGALGLAVTLVEDPESRVQRRWTKRSDANVRDRVSRAMVKRARATVLHELASKGGRSWWARMLPEQRQAYIAKLNAARAAKRQAGLNEAA
jgi:hypothetical protein